MITNNMTVECFLQVTYVSYYSQQYGKDIQDPDQPLLLSMIKPRRNAPVQEEKLVALIPELCHVTGLTDEQRTNFAVMKDLGEHTRLQPHQRKAALTKFIGNVNGMT
jgi:aubergine-like protein